MASTLTLSRPRPNRPRSLIRSASLLLALLFVLLRPMCDAFAATGEGHERVAAAHGNLELSDNDAGGHAGDEVCCSSIDGQVLTVPAVPPLPTTSSANFAPPPGATYQVFTSVAQPLRFIALCDLAPPQRYHARSLRRLD